MDYPSASTSSSSSIHLTIPPPPRSPPPDHDDLLIHVPHSEPDVEEEEEDDEDDDDQRGHKSFYNSFHRSVVENGQQYGDGEDEVEDSGTKHAHREERDEIGEEDLDQEEASLESRCCGAADADDVMLSPSSSS